MFTKEEYNRALEIIDAYNSQQETLRDLPCHILHNVIRNTYVVFTSKEEANRMFYDGECTVVKGVINPVYKKAE
jgi:hypothetical protein